MDLFRDVLPIAVSKW